MTKFASYMLPSFKQWFALQWQLHWHHARQHGLALMFFPLTVLLFPLALGAKPILLQAIAPAVIWIGVLFTQLLLAEQWFKEEWRLGMMTYLHRPDFPFATWLMAKLLVQWLLLYVPLWGLSPLVLMMFHWPWEQWWIVIVTLMIGSPIVMLLTALGASFVLGVRASHFLLIILVLPLLIPCLIFALGAVEMVQTQQSPVAHLWLLSAILVLCLTLIPPTIHWMLKHIQRPID